METTKKSQIVGIKNAGIVIICCFIVAVCIYQFLLGNPSNFMNNDPNNHPLNMLGTIYKGGVIVPVIQTLLLTVLALSIERYFALRSAFGKGSLAKFVANIKEALATGDLKKAQEICDQQRGSVANVVTATLRKYEEMEKNTALPKEQKLLAIQKELEEATALEMPMMQQNLPIIATITTLGTLMGLLGTVIGMIRSFAALSAGGGADSMALSQGISEALINTAFGILTGALAVISYNYYTKKKDTFIDMTAMSDVTVLLLTFFMLTSTFVKKEPVQVTTPASVSEIKIPETNVLQILVDPEGKIFMSLDKQQDMQAVLESMGEEYGIKFTPEQEKRFTLATTFGVPIRSMQQFLDLPEDQRDKVLKNEGIPCDSTDNQFKSWVRNARNANADLRIAIKADASTPYSVIKNVMNSLQDLRENRYNLITSLKAESEN